MSGDGYSELRERLKKSDKTWEEEIKRLKHDIKKTESRIIMTEKRRKLFDKTTFDIEGTGSDAESLNSEARSMDPYFMKNVERVIPGRQLVPQDPEPDAKWVSPSLVMRKRSKLTPDVSLDESALPDNVAVSGSEVGSPKRIRSSPPQRLERSREWKSPHRVVDRPKPEDALGNWVPITETRRQDEVNLNGDYLPPRPISQSTYTVRRAVLTPELEQPRHVRKTTILDDFEPEPAAPKKRPEPVAYHVIGNEHIKRIVHPDGRIVKVSTLEDMSFGVASKTEDKADHPENAGKGPDSDVRPVRRNTTKKMVLKDLPESLTTGGSPRKLRPPKRAVEPKSATSQNEDQNKENKPRNGKTETEDVMTELKKILEDKNESEETCGKRKPSIERKKSEEDAAKKAKTEEKKPEKKRRDVDMKAVQKYIKLQKMKRIEQLKIEREKKAIQEESKKKKLEELRVRTLQLAATSKKKPSEAAATIKIVETEEDVTMSLGLKQIKPKVSYNESVLNLKKKASPKPEPKRSDVVEPKPQKPELPVEEPETIKEMDEIPPPLTPPQSEMKLESPKIDLEKNTNLTLKKLAEALQITMQKKPTQGSKSSRDVAADVPEKAVDNRNIITIDVDTIKSLKQDIKKISENFQVLHEIITDKTTPPPNPEPILSAKVSQMSLVPRGKPNQAPEGWLRNIVPRPHPYNVMTAMRNKMKVRSVDTSDHTPCSEGVSSKYDTGSVRTTSNLYSTTDEPELYSDLKTTKSTNEDNYFSVREDSGSELSSSILDSEKDRFFCMREALTKPTDRLKSSTPQYDATSSTIDTTSVSSKFPSSKEDLVPPDIQLISSNQPSQTSSEATTLQTKSEIAEDTPAVTSETIEEITKPETSDLQVVTRTFFNPEALHLQFQAELTLLETFQRSLAHFMEVERLKALSQVNKNDKAVGTEDIAEEETVEENFDSRTSDVKSTSESKREKKNNSDLLDVSTGGISFQMLNRMMKDEELRSEHQLALIRLREKTLIGKVKAELTFLEMRKKSLKENGSDEEQAISAIKKKQRGILLKYQNEKEDIERLKKMHRIASEERKIMIKQQKQIQKMQLSTKDMLIKLKKRDKSPQKRSPIRLKALKHSGSQSEVQEDFSINAESNYSESITSLDETIDSDLDLTTKSNASEDDEILKRNRKALEEKISKEKSISSNSERKHLKRGHSAEELLKWTKRLEEKENRLKEMETMKLRSGKNFRDGKISVRDRSTSPFQFQEVVKSICESSPSLTEVKSSSIVELIESKPGEKEETTEKSSESVPEKLTTVDDFSKKTPATSRSIEYNSESFESSSDTHKSKPEVIKSRSSERISNGVTIKMALSPRVHTPRRRYSSGSDESINLFHTETASEQSDVEIRIAALHEQLRRRKLEAERLRREQKRAHRERLKAKEQSLIKQIEAYDTYIQKKKQELEEEYEKTSHVVVKPVIKSPKVSDRVQSKKSDEEDGKYSLKLALRKRETSISEKIVPESESEIGESIRNEEVSVREEATLGKDVESSIDSEIATETRNKDVSNSTTASMLESLPKQTVVSDGSHSESEDHTISNSSVKTTLISPEKPETSDKTRTTTTEATEIDEIREPERNYSSETFETYEKSEVSVREEIGEDVSKEESVQEVENEKTESEEEPEEEEESEVEEAEEEEEKVETEEATLVEEEEKEEDVAEDTDAEEVLEEDKETDKMVELITESVLDDLVNESMEIMLKKKEAKDRAMESDVGVVTNLIATELVEEVIQDAVRLYNRKKLRNQEETLDVRRRIHEIMSSAPAPKREQRRPQDIMVTTYDLPPAAVNDDLTSPEREEFLQSLSPPKQDKSFKIEAGSLEAQPQEGEYGQEWFDDDFGLSRTRREAEELRLQQIQIEQEIQQLQAQQEQVPYYYLRQIPNKPPPPYTPPGAAAVERFTSESEITAVVSSAVRILSEELGKGRTIADIQPSVTFFTATDSDHVKCYKVFLFDLAKHIIGEVIGVEFEEDKLPWMRTNEKLSKYKLKKIDRTYECLHEVVMKQVLVLFGFRQKMGKERLIVRWSRKKRDHVDELLVGESQEEESEWTHYDEDEVAVKNNVTIGILDSLLDETANLLNQIWSKKMKMNN